jgi:uncharacterized protein (TIGR03435 family)
MKAVVWFVLGIALGSIPIFSQAPIDAKPQFEVASIKLHPPPVTRTIISAPPGRFVAEGISLRMLVGRGYGVSETNVLGGPGWTDSDRFDIDARVNGTIPLGQMSPLIRAMLEDRFQLKVHKETRDLPVYELVVAKGGLKMKKSEDQTPPVPLPPPDRGAPPRGAGPFAGGPLPRGAFGGGRGNFQGIAVTIATVVNFLTQNLGRPVIDKTGLSGLYDLKLEWTPGAEQAPGPFGPGVPPAADAAGPSIFTALQEQLGLRLESTKGPVEVVVIDGATKPSEN